MIVANAKRRQRVAKELWAILNSSYDRLDVSDFLPFGRPIKYHCDPKLETAGPCVVWDATKDNVTASLQYLMANSEHFNQS